MKLPAAGHRLLHKRKAIALQWNGPLPRPDIRDGSEIRPVAANTSCDPTGPLYYMYRDVSRSIADRAWLRKEGLRFDLTVIPPGEICGECVKTMGHYHPETPDGTGYPEIYEVLAGTAHYMLQSRDLDSVVLVTAKKGDVVIIPPGYGHVTINPSPDREIQMANVVSSRFASEYLPYVCRRGAPYYEMADGSMVKNPSYPEVRELRTFSAADVAHCNGSIASPLYRLIEQRAPVLRFLNCPGEYGVMLGKQYREIGVTRCR